MVGAVRGWNILATVSSRADKRPTHSLSPDVRVWAVAYRLQGRTGIQSDKITVSDDPFATFRRADVSSVVSIRPHGTTQLPPDEFA